MALGSSASSSSKSKSIISPKIQKLSLKQKKNKDVLPESQVSSSRSAFGLMSVNYWFQQGPPPRWKYSASGFLPELVKEITVIGQAHYWNGVFQVKARDEVGRYLGKS